MLTDTGQLRPLCSHQWFCPTERVQGAGLPMERAILHGKLEEHEKALHTLVHELRDFPAAEDYCLWRSEGRDPAYRQRLFHTLLALYLGPSPSGPELAVAAVDLLNRHAAEFDAAQVLQLLPGTWSVQLLCPFLTGAMRDSIHSRRTAQVALSLARSENLIYQYDKVRARWLPDQWVFPYCAVPCGSAVSSSSVSSVQHQARVRGPTHRNRGLHGGSAGSRQSLWHCSPFRC